MIVPPVTRSRRIVPSPLPVLTVTVRVEPLPPTPVTEAPVTPVVVSTKSPFDTPLTASENVTVKLTLAALDGFASARVIETTVGGVLSIVYVWPRVKLVLG